MNKLIVVAMILITHGATLAADANDAAAILHEYFAEFNGKNVETIANDVYSTPVHIGGGASHRIYANPDEAVASLTNLYEQIESQGWVESRIEDVKVCVASATLALVDTRYSRIDENGAAIPPAIRTTLYVVQKIDDRWRIVAFYGHDNDLRPGCS